MFGQRKGTDLSTQTVRLSFGYAGVILQLPTDWVQRAPDSPHTGARFVGPSDTVFRVSLFSMPGEMTAREVLAKLRSASSGHIEDLENNKALLTHSVLSDGGATETRLWQLAVPLNPSEVLAVLFSYAFDTSHETSSRAQREIALLDKQIRDRPVWIEIRRE